MFVSDGKKYLLTNYKILYDINEKDEKLALSSFVVSREKWFDVESHAKQNERLLKDLTIKLFTKFLRSRREEKWLVMGMN